MEIGDLDCGDILRESIAAGKFGKREVWESERKTLLVAPCMVGVQLSSELAGRRASRCEERRQGGLTARLTSPSDRQRVCTQARATVGSVGRRRGVGTAVPPKSCGCNGDQGGLL